jgi:hypothetical protein
MKNFQNTILVCNIINQCEENNLIHLLKSIQFELVEDMELKIMIRTLLNSAESIKKYAKITEDRFLESKS